MIINLDLYFIAIIVTNPIIIDNELKYYIRLMLCYL